MLLLNLPDELAAKGRGRAVTSDPDSNPDSKARDREAEPLSQRVSMCCNRKELHEWGSMYGKKFGYVFVICASGKNSKDILTKLKVKE
ncbi:hypothetical protein Ahy_B03g063667 [Arachis hypogaea]|uniref:Oxo-4-hydroxy-4-carboxy-5-ureidoimidazoline decarboxylase domain-containing protein n=1 Tax=Arachis hypogaea TaxID=3818 RepID=A0A444ZXS2_ARAHY|nr:hypothetical protein Ahy_B03g063667 [Arachis hypogaea]